MYKISNNIAEEEIKLFEENDIFHEMLLNKSPEMQELSLERLIELEEDNYDSLETDYSKTHKHYSTLE